MAIGGRVSNGCKIYEKCNDEYLLSIQHKIFVNSFQEKNLVNNECCPTKVSVTMRLKLKRKALVLNVVKLMFAKMNSFSCSMELKRGWPAGHMY